MSKNCYEKISADENDDTDQPSHPVKSANFLSLLTFWWMNSVFKTGSKRPLNQSDFLPLHEKDRTRDLTERLQKEWNKQVQECNRTKAKQPKLWKCVLRTLSCREISFILILWSIECTSRVCFPLVLGLLLRLLSSPEMDRPLVYACCFLLGSSGLTALSQHFAVFRAELLGMRLSSAIKGIIYLKVRLTIMMYN